MTIRAGILFAALLASASMIAAMPAQALTPQECSAKYQAAKTAGTLGDQKWNDFRKAQCGAEAAPVAGAAPKEPQKDSPKMAAAKAKEASKAAPAPAGPAVFPTAIAPKHSSLKAARARMKTCLDQYNANKAANTNGGLKWLQKGGGYYSECNKRLKV